MTVHMRVLWMGLLMKMCQPTKAGGSGRSSRSSSESSGGSETTEDEEAANRKMTMYREARKGVRDRSEKRRCMEINRGKVLTKEECPPGQKVDEDMKDLMRKKSTAKGSGKGRGRGGAKSEDTNDELVVYPKRERKKKWTEKRKGGGEATSKTRRLRRRVNTMNGTVNPCSGKVE